MNKKMAAVSPTMLQMLADLQQDVLLDLWEIDLRAFCGEQVFLCNQQSQVGAFVVWKGVKYQSYSIIGEGFELSGQGTSNRPKLTVSNLLGLVAGLVASFNQLIGATVIRCQTYARFLDAANFISGSLKDQNIPNTAEEITSKYVIERLSNLDAETAVFELALSSEADGAVMPARIMLANVCSWQYRSEGCGYTSKPVADRFGNPTSDLKKRLL